MQAELAIAHAELTRIHTPTVPALQDEQEHHPAVSNSPLLLVSSFLCVWLSFPNFSQYLPHADFNRVYTSTVPRSRTSSGSERRSLSTSLHSFVNFRFLGILLPRAFVQKTAQDRAVVFVVPVESVTFTIVRRKLPSSPLYGESRLPDAIPGRSSFGTKIANQKIMEGSFALQPRDLSKSFFLSPLGLCFRMNRCGGRERPFE
jgi:hypothetical protein